MKAVADDHVVGHDHAQAERHDLQAVSVQVLHGMMIAELLAKSEVTRALRGGDLSHVDCLSDVRAHGECLNAKTLGGCLAEKVPFGDFLGVLVGHGLVHVLGSEISLPVL